MALLRAYANIANEMEEAGYSEKEITKVKSEIRYYEKMREEIKLHSGDYVDMKRYEPAMRRLLDTYIRAEDSVTVANFEELGLIEMIVKKGLGALDDLPEGLRSNPEAMAETIENNIRKVIIEERAINPKYYEQMSELLDALIQERREQAIEYQAYLERVKQLVTQVVQPDGASPSGYPSSLDTRAKRALFDNLEQDEGLALRVDTAVLNTKKDGWIGNRFKEREVFQAIREAVGDKDIDIDALISLVANQDEYK